MFTIGLTGGIGTGKSTVAEFFRKRGARMVDMDRIAHQVQEPGTPTWHAIVEHFGTGILDERERIDRKKLGAIVFTDERERHTLNRIIHPSIFDEWRRVLQDIRNSDPEAIVVSEIPLLIEGGWNHLFNVTVLVWASSETQLKRIMARNNLTRLEAEARLAAQMKIDDKIPLVDYVIANNGDISRTEHDFENLWNAIVHMKEAHYD